MTSVLRRYAQIDPRTQNVYVIEAANFYTYDSTQSIPSSPVMTTTDFRSSYGNNTGVFPAGSLLKDMGRSIQVYEPTLSNNTMYIFRQMMLIDGVNYEGISNQIGYVCTWASSWVTPYNPDYPLDPLYYAVARLARMG